MKKILTVLLFSIIVISCRKKEGDLRWTNEVLAPLFTSTLTLQNISPLNKFDTASDGLLILNREQEIINFITSDLFHIPDTEVRANVTIDSLRLADRSIEQSITLEQIYPQASLLNGQTFPIPANSATNLSPFDVDGSGLFKTATFTQGMLDITINNGFPIELEILKFELRNKLTKEIIISDEFNNISAGTSATKSVDLAGKTIATNMEILVSELKTAASNGPVLINKNDAVNVKIMVSNSRVSEATAIFPSQSVYSKKENSEYYFDGAELKKITIKSGVMRMRVVSTIQENMTISYQIPNATYQGNFVSQILNVPAAPPTKNVTITKDFDLAGYELDLRGKNPVVDDLFNKFYNELDVRIDSSGIERTITLNDSVYIYYGLLDLIPEKATGYFGSKTIVDETGNIDFDLFQDINGELKVDDLKMSLNVDNGLGLGDKAITLGLNALTSRNTKTNNMVTLNTSSVLYNPTEIFSATDNPFKPTKMSFLFDKNNSNIIPFFENVGNKIDYDITVKMNPNGIKDYTQFVYDKSTLKATMNIEMPMNIAARNFGLSQENEFNFSTQENGDRIKEGTLYFVCKNGFPLELKLQIYILDINGNIIDSLISTPENIVQAANPTALNTKITEAKESVLKCVLDETKMKTLKNNPKVIIQFGISTPNYDTKTKLYDTYKIDINVTGKFKYEQQLTK